ncbi:MULTISPECIES: ABC transporter permease [unclassified Nocardiopsis]|uniref:ABC transporter permease n=1 Tax=unclassified Nocardiopsis TaxID=2649073 RepID=UPI00066B9786|nr:MULTISPECIES: ABC transporter permease [unclassified Nocardiopsis]MBQ1083766.1 ABC transporter permease [Nocardiopsis sp. B62]
MTRLIVVRLFFGALTLWAVSLVVFAATQALPGDAAQLILGRDATPERLEALRNQLNLHEPVAVQYMQWLQGLVQGDLGTSFSNRMPVAEYLTDPVRSSLTLMGLSALVATPIALFVGAFSALRRDRAFDHTSSMGTLVLASVPEFVVGILLILLLGPGGLGVFPSVYAREGGPEQWVLPVLTLALAVAPPIVRMMRATMIEVLESEYVQQARLKGMGERTVLWRHAAPNAIGPVAQVVALQLAWLAGGVVAIEFLFNFPGVGKVLMDAIGNRDVPLIQAVVLLIAGIYILVNLVADVIGLAANPKVRVANR